MEQMAAQRLDSAVDKERAQSTEQFLWRDVSRDTNRSIENPEPAHNTSSADDIFNGSSVSNASSVAAPELPQLSQVVSPLVEESHSCRLDGYERDWFGPMGCTCKSACEDGQVANSSHTAKMCSTQHQCFGVDAVPCTSSARTINSCHATCSSCSPGRDSDGLPSKSACRSWGARRGWLPEETPMCSLGNQQGLCEPYPTPKQQCRTVCSPRTLTTLHRVQVVKKISPVDNSSDIENHTDVTNLPTLVCSKLCTVPQQMRFGSVDATVFCTVEKLVTCQQKPGNETSFECNSMKKTRYVGYQWNDDLLYWQNPHSLKEDKLLYMHTSDHAQRLQQDWSSINPTVGGLRNTSMTTELPPIDTMEFNIHNALQEMLKENPSGLCLAHGLIT